MSASDHIQPKLFHGTAHFFKEGELVNTGTQNLHTLMGMTEPRAYASADIRRAEEWAGMKAEDEGMLFGPVYEVEVDNPVHIPPELLNSNIADKEAYAGLHRHTYSSTSPMRPKGIVGWGVNPKAISRP